MLVSQHALQSRQAPSCFGATHSKPIGLLLEWTVEVWLAFLGGLPSMFVALMRMIKFFGMVLPWFTKSLTILCSLVGIQWVIDGVLRATSQIFFKCWPLWISPASCHLKYGLFSLSIMDTIASTHAGLNNWPSLLYWAFLLMEILCSFLSWHNNHGIQSLEFWQAWIRFYIPMPVS